METFPSNSHKVKVAKDGAATPPAPESESEDKKITPVVSGDVVRRKKPVGKRFMETFVTGVSAKEALSYVVLDILIPAAKDAAADGVSMGIEKMLFGETRSSSRRNRSNTSPYGGGFTSYNRFSQNGGRREDPRDPRPPLSRPSRSSHNIDEIIIPNRPEAEAVIDQLFDIMSRFEMVSVADLYECVNISSNFIDNKWGWTDLRGANVRRVRGGYLLDLPRPEPLD